MMLARVTFSDQILCELYEATLALQLRYNADSALSAVGLKSCSSSKKSVESARKSFKFI